MKLDETSQAAISDMYSGSLFLAAVLLVLAMAAPALLYP